MKRYIDEYFEVRGKETLTSNFSDIKNLILEYHNNGMPIMHIVEHLQEKYYLFTDKEETDYLLLVINKIINGEPVQNRFTKVIFE